MRPPLLIGPTVSLSQSSLFFGNVESGKSVTKLIYIENHSDVPSYYQIDAEVAGTFKLDNNLGVVAPHSSSHISVTFAPTEPANYHRRLVVVVKDRAPLAFDAVGTCFSDKRRPAPLVQSQVDDYRAR